PTAALRALPVTPTRRTAHFPPFACLPMESTAFCTVRIFSSSSSGISISKASSKAITSSTVSIESAPRSSTNEAFGVTSPSSTPSCSTMICFTFSSTAAMFCPRSPYVCARNHIARTVVGTAALGCPVGRKLGLFAYLRMLLDVVESVLHGAEFLGIFIGNLHAEGFLQCHDELNLIK